MRLPSFVTALPLLATAATAKTISSLPSKGVVEYALPAAAQTHEILPVGDNLLLVTQQTDGSLLKIALDDNGQPTGARKYTLTNQWSGLHGLTLGAGSKGQNATVWATVQFDNAVLQIDPHGDDIDAEPEVIKTIPVPSPASGPHGVLEHKGDLWLACKDSSHVVRVNIDDPKDHQVWPVSGRPIFTAVHPTSGDVYSGLDTSSKIWRYKNDGKAGEEMDVPPEKGSTPVGTVSGPDGNVWIVLAGNATAGTGTFGRINEDASVDWFTLGSKIGKTAGILHLAFDKDPSRFWLLGSSTVCNTCPDAVFTVEIDEGKGGTSGPRISKQNSIVLPTQGSWTHRLVSHKGSIYVTELLTSTLAHVTGAAVGGLNVSEPWDQFSNWGLGLKAQGVNYNN